MPTPATSVRAKFVCNGKIPGYGNQTTVHFSAVYSADPNSENKAFTDATPSGHLQICIANDKPALDLFQQGKAYYLDFTPAD